MFGEPPHLTSLAADLRRVAGAELRDELEITEAETEQGRLRHRSTVQVWEHAMHRGDAVSVITRHGRIGGTVDYVGLDYATVVRPDRAWDVRLERSVLATADRSPAGGHTVTGGSRTFRARLAEYEATGEAVTVLVPALDLELRGRIGVAATDHVIVIDGPNTVTIPTELIDAIRRDL